MRDGIDSGSVVPALPHLVERRLQEPIADAVARVEGHGVVEVRGVELGEVAGRHRRRENAQQDVRDMLDVDALHSRSARDENEAERDAEHEGTTRGLLTGQFCVPRATPARDLLAQGGLHRRGKLRLELRHDEELDGSLDLGRRMSQLIHDRDEASAIGSRVQQASGREELQDEPAYGGLHGLRPGRRGQRGATREAILQGSARGPGLASHPGKGEIAPALLRRHPHGGSAQRPIGSPHARRREQVGHAPTILRKTPYCPTSRGRAASDCSRGSRSPVRSTSSSTRPRSESTVQRA